MESTSDRHWATKYLLEPLNAPEPSQETGPGSHFKSTTPTSPTNRRHSSTKSSMTSSGVSFLPTPPPSASPTHSSFHPSNPFSTDQHRSSGSPSQARSHRSRRSVDTSRSKRDDRRESSSPLPARFAGDNSMRPLEQLRKETKQAYRSPHLRHLSLPKADQIDVLDESPFGIAYHHEGPYDATLLTRNTNKKYSPVAATKSTNEKALQATPREHLLDSLHKHVPLQGTAVVPSGERGPNGEIMEYEQGADLQREPDASGGAYKRWADMTYHPDDHKGKGEPSFSIERALKEHKHSSCTRNMSDGNVSYEMQSQTPRRRPVPNRQRSVSGSHADLSRPSGSGSNATGSATASGNSMSYAMFEADLHRRNSTGHGFGAGLKRHIGSLRGKKEQGV